MPLFYYIPLVSVCVNFVARKYYRFASFFRISPIANDKSGHVG
ncbi:hypothetical protein HMPREF7215_0018 [Pyramidobacter piscolens W5455]|uniref:Uncharacterized protein n=1 Tax=Pyramidobacter piscolens W5455 TaxID=352165 RepID=A0ABM9ZRK4_9BACT|nr:hypothetical protein HMPREF7215_0018 [Pyramidobacter piscolens W5455]